MLKIRKGIYMDFLKKNFHDVLKLYINQIGISIFYFAIIFPLNTISGEDGLPAVWDLVVSLFSMLFYFTLIYCVVWEIGAKDKIRVDSGRYEPTPKKGFLLGVFATIPNLIFSVPLVLFAIIGCFTTACKNAYGIFVMLARLHEVFYNSIISSFVGVNGLLTPFTGDMLNSSEPVHQLVYSLILFILPLFAILVTHFAYYMGSHERKLFASVSKIFDKK